MLVQFHLQSDFLWEVSLPLATDSAMVVKSEEQVIFDACAKTSHLGVHAGATG